MPVKLVRPDGYTRVRPVCLAEGDEQRPFWRIVTDKASGTSELFIYDEISYWALNASDFSNQLAAVNASELVVRVNSLTITVLR